jgi:cytosine/adenosine deaminase-related metal-dependent hydrolase
MDGAAARHADILIEDDRIAAVAPNIDASDARRIDAGGCIVMPGFVDAHRHLWQGALAQIAPDVDLGGYFALLGDHGPRFTSDDVATGVRLGAAQAIDAGVTTIFDWSHIMNSPEHADVAVAALRASGIRAVFAYGFPNRPDWLMGSSKPHPEDARRVRRELLPGDDDLVTMALAVRGPEMSSIEVTAADLALARELDLPVSMHIGSPFAGVVHAVEALARHGLAGPDIQYVHANATWDSELRIIADTGGQLVITPSVELQMKFGLPATGRALEAGLRPGLGVDVVTSAGPDMFIQMRAALQAARLDALLNGRRDVTAGDALAFATIDAARSIGLGHRIGSLAAGKLADLLILRPPAATPINDPVAWVVLAAHPGNIEAVYIAGVRRSGTACPIAPQEAA